jgi:hypothetical protein
VKKILLPAIAITLFTAALSCGDSIETAQNFRPDEAPVIISKSITRYDGKEYDSYRLISNTAFYLTVNAYDPEGGAIAWEFTSEHGSFGEPEITDTGVRVIFVTGKIVQADSVDIGIRAIDRKKKSSVETLHVGTGKPVPKITVNPGSVSITADGTAALTLSADCDGVFQLLCDNSITSASGAHIDTSVNVFSYDGTGTVAAAVSGPLSTVTGRVKLPPSGSGSYANTVYRVWVIFCDAMNQECAELCEVTVN